MNAQYYKSICNKLSKNIDSEKLNTLKNVFCDEINSKRLLCRIKNFHQLLTILERRDVIGTEHEGNLKRICDVVLPGSTEFRSTLDEINDTRGNIRVIPPLAEQPIERIHALVRNEIGSKWKEFARALSIQEGTIETLESQHRGHIPDMTEEILQSHAEKYKSNISLWRSELQRALTDARRRDLSREIDSILAIMPMN